MDFTKYHGILGSQERRIAKGDIDIRDAPMYREGYSAAKSYSNVATGELANAYRIGFEDGIRARSKGAMKNIATAISSII